MKTYILIIVQLVLIACCWSCERSGQIQESLVYNYDRILDISYTPDSLSSCTGWFTDQGSWLGFTIPEKDHWVNGFCGPFDLESRRWLSKSLVTVGFANSHNGIFKADSVNYFPGEVFIRATSGLGTIDQRMLFLDKSTILLQCSSECNDPFVFSGSTYLKNTVFDASENSCGFLLPSGEELRICFQDNVKIRVEGNKYVAESAGGKEAWIVISLLDGQRKQAADQTLTEDILFHPSDYVAKHHQLWDGYLKKVLRSDMPFGYDRVAVKAVVTLMANWRSSRGGLLHDGVVPSHAMGYFMGFWAWDSWKHAVALAVFAPELAKSQVRAMFDYQQEDGMIIDCIYPDINENNARDSKPPLAAWAVNEIYKETGDTAFVREMYPQLLHYYRWWFAKRDHNLNGICEFGSVDGTLEAAAWESGMDNAIRFDNATMVQNAEDAWSFNQESVDLNAFLAFEYQLLKELSVVAGQSFSEVDHTKEVGSYFFDEEKGFFYDKQLDGRFIREEGSEAYIPFWTGIASKEQMDRALVLFTDTAKFSTYIPFPTVAADNPKFMAKGYWRGPIWLDQTYFGISGLRKYGYWKQADEYTRQVFDRLQGLKESGAIHENYGTRTGEPLKASHFSWSSAHLLMLYWEYGKKSE